MLPFSVSCNAWTGEATVAQQAEQLICNQRVGGSIPFGGSRERFPSGQREQTVNLPAKPSEVRILPSPPEEFADEGFDGTRRTVFQYFLRCGSSSVVERQPSKLRVAGSNPVSRSIDSEGAGDTQTGRNIKSLWCMLPAESCAHVAQSVEHILGKDEVTGSIPVMGSVSQKRELTRIFY